MKKRISVLVPVGTVAFGLVVGAIATSSSDSSPGFSRLSASGKVVPVAGGGRWATVFANHRGRTFYRRQFQGLTCYGRGKLTPAGAMLPGSERCPLKAGMFPSPEQPVLAAMTIESWKQTLEIVTIKALGGFAADGVVSMQFVREDGSVLAEGAVRNNTFSLAVEGMNLNARRALIARDKEGNVIYREVFGPKGMS